jgi:hypothetical protein
MHCLFKTLMHIPCPGCGLTRSFACLLDLDFRGAFYYHPLWILVLGFLCVLPFRPVGIIRYSKVLLMSLIGVYIFRLFVSSIFAPI